MIIDLLKIGDTKYKLMFNSETNDYYLTQEITTTIPKWKFLWFKRHKKVIESISHMELNLSTLTIMYNILTLKPDPNQDHISDDFEMSAKFEMVSEIDNKKFRDKFMVRLDDIDDTDGVTFNVSSTNTPKNDIVKGYVKEGWHYFSTHDESSMRRTHYVYKSGLYGGYLHINVIDEIGFRSDDSITTAVNTLIIPREVIDMSLRHMGYFN